MADLFQTIEMVKKANKQAREEAFNEGFAPFLNAIGQHVQKQKQLADVSTDMNTMVKEAETGVPQTYKTGIPTIIVGVDPRTGAEFTDHSAEVYAGWCNAAKGMDAWGAQAASFGNLWKATAEINESLYPHVQWSRDYRTDSGGPGQWRGLCGSHYVKEVRADAKVYTYVVGMKYPMPGICGGIVPALLP